MSFTGVYKQTWRMAGLAILILSLAGPWAYDVIHVPAAYSCNKPFIRLEGDYCGKPMPGLLLILWLSSGLIGNLVNWLAGTEPFLSRGRELFIMFLSISPILLFFSTPFSLWKEDSRGSNIFQSLAWGLAAVLGLFWMINGINLASGQLLWGSWAYTILTLIVLTLELVALAVERKGKPGI